MEPNTLLGGFSSLIKAPKTFSSLKILGAWNQTGPILFEL